MEIIDKYKRELDEDTKIEVLNLCDAQMKLPAIKHKWVSRLLNHKMEQDKIEKLITEAKHTIVTKQTKDSKVKVSKASLEKMAEDHPTVLKLKEKLKEEGFVIMYLEKVEQIFKSMSFDIRNITEIMKLEQQ
jgi:hypothetical protein